VRLFELIADVIRERHPLLTPELLPLHLPTWRDQLDS